MKRLLIITGDLAAGKSSFAKILSKRYCAEVMYKDRIKEILCDILGFKSREENLALSVATVELMIYHFSEIAELGYDLILEANFKEGELKKLHGIAEKKGYSVLTICLEADMDIIYRRFVNRIENENRHPAHLSGFEGYESFAFYIEKARKEKPLGDVIKVNANDFSYQTDEKTLSQIDAFMGG